MEPTEAKLDYTNAKDFILAGNALFTLVSQKTGARYTYKVRKSESKPGYPECHFVKLLTGPQNTADYTYIGMIRDGKFKTTAKSKLPVTSAPVAGFDWTLEKLTAGQEPKHLEIWHAGRCGRCGRVLTVPESVQNGFGPECIGRI